MNVQINRSRFDPRGEREGRKAECPGQRNVGRVLERGLGDLEHECVLIPLTGPKPFKKKKREREREREIQKEAGTHSKAFQAPAGNQIFHCLLFLLPGGEWVAWGLPSLKVLPPWGCLRCHLGDREGMELCIVCGSPRFRVGR